jgi:anaerobic dimethyl sulfoxide reductase subunit A
MGYIYPFFCGKDCGGVACPLLATVENGRIMHVTHNPAAGPFLRGCPRGLHLPLEQEAPVRILTPLIRTGPRGSGQFRPAAWGEALQYTADRLAEIRAQSGPQAVLARGSAGVLGAMHSSYAVLGRFMHFFGGCTQLTSNYSVGAAQFILPYVLGSGSRRAGFDPATIQSAEMIVLWGANVLETRQGTEVPWRIREAKRKGKQIVVIDPRRSDTVRNAASWWLPCRPGTDAALMLAVLHVLFSEDLADRAALQRLSAGFEQLEDYVLGRRKGAVPPCSPEWAEVICGVGAGEIKRFARAYAAAKPAMLFPGYSIQRVFNGEDTYRLTVALQIATGNFGILGGSTGAPNNALPAPRVGRLPIPPLPPQPSVPVLRWPDAILQGTAGGYPSEIRAVYNVGSNLVNQGSDIRKNLAAFQKLELAVTHEVFLTPTAQQCDVIFPASTAFEKEDIGTPWAGNYLLYKPQILPPAGEARSDYEILAGLAEYLGFNEDFTGGRSPAAWIQKFLDESEVPDQEEFRRTGMYFAPEQERVGLADFASDPLSYPLDTPSGKVEIASQAYHHNTGFPAIPEWQAPPHDPGYPLSLITPKSPHFTHSQGSNLPELRKRAEHALEMHPTDATARGIQTGQMVRIRNRQGETRVPVHVTDDMTPGVVCLREGMWVRLDEDGVDRAGAANMLTSTGGTAAGVNAVMHGVGVEVEAVGKIFE